MVDNLLQLFTFIVIMILQAILLPIISAAIGWFTNWVAIKMLFRPQQPKKILSITFHGVFPKNQKIIAEKLGDIIALELFSSKDIRGRMTPDATMVRKVMEEKIDHYLNNTFSKSYPIISALFGEKRKAKIKNELLLEVEKAAPDVIDQYLLNIEQEIDVAHIVKEKIEQLSPARLEDLIMLVLNKELKFIEIVGAVIGFLIGIVQVIIVGITS